MPLQEIAEELLRETGASRTTIRLEVVPGGELEVVAESTAPGVESLRGKPTVRREPRSSPGPFEVMQAELRVIVQDDVVTSAPAFPELVDLYGVRAQLLAPIVRGGRLAGVVSVHDAELRKWTEQEIDALRNAAARVQSEVGRTGRSVRPGR